MTEVLITVHGDVERFLPPQRATVHLSVMLDGPDQAAVLEQVTSSADQVSRSITQGHDQVDGPVTWYAREATRTWSFRPWSTDGAVVPLVHSAVVDFQVKFSDFDALALWLSFVCEFPGVRVQSVDWTLTQQVHDDLLAQARKDAVLAAKEKADAYADSLGLGVLYPVAVADTGMLTQQGGQSASLAIGATRGKAAAAAGGDMPALAPKDVRIAASVDAQFAAGIERPSAPRIRCGNE